MPLEVKGRVYFTLMGPEDTGIIDGIDPNVLDGPYHVTWDRGKDSGWYRADQLCSCMTNERQLEH